MSFGIIEYNKDGLPKCEICGKYFDRVATHVRQKHCMSERDYKLQFGFDLIKGICSRESAIKSRDKVFENYDKCIAKNLIENGKSTRFEKGCKGRTRDQCSQQTLNMLADRLDDWHDPAVMAASGYKLGKSGVGNKARWEKYKESKK